MSGRLEHDHRRQDIGKLAIKQLLKEFAGFRELLAEDNSGNNYETDLAQLLKQSENCAELMENSAHKKELGIYYTPAYIVDWMVRNTLGELLNNRKIDAEKIRVLDPACGSGAFLLKAFDLLNGCKTGGSFIAKARILENNIFGVDLDRQAVEVARLNLLLKIAARGWKLPFLQDNIKCGNSLIDDSMIAGDKALNWGEEFRPIMQEGGFDVVIGNPPWVSLKGKQKRLDMSEDELSYLLSKYPCDSYRPNLFEMFIWQGLSLVKEGGYLSFIVPDRICYNGQFADLRENMLKNFSLRKLWFRPAFAGVISDNMIFVLKKERSTNRRFVEIAEYPSMQFKRVPQEVYSDLSGCPWFIVNDNLFKLFNKIKQRREVFELEDKFQTKVGFIARPHKIAPTQQSDRQMRIFKGENILRFGTRGNYYFEFKKENLAGGTQDIEKLGKKNKVFLRKTGRDLIATFDNSGTYPEQSVYFIYINEDGDAEELKLLPALLNSKLLNCYYRNFAVTNRDATPQLKKVDLDKFPIIFPDHTQPFAQKIERMLSLRQRLGEIEDKRADERAELEEQIAKTDDEIDQMVYGIYGLAENEQKIITESLP